MTNINTLAAEAYSTAVRRGKTAEKPSHKGTLSSILDEVAEYNSSSEISPSEHLPQYSEAAEELADIIIACFTELHSRGVNVEYILRDKINYNKTRK